MLRTKTGIRQHTKRLGRAEEEARDPQGSRRTVRRRRRLLRPRQPSPLRLQARRKDTYIRSNNDILPITLNHLRKQVQAYEEPNARHKAPAFNPKPPGVALLKSRERARVAGHPDTNRKGDDLTGIQNNAGREGCDKCGARDHWKATCPHADVSPVELAILRAKNSAGPQLVTVGGPGDGTEATQEGASPPDAWANLEGVALVSPAANFITPKLDPHKLYLDNCASHSQMYRKEYISDSYETQMRLHLISNGGPSTASEWGLIFGAYGAWIVPTGVANLWSAPELERKGFIVESHTHRNWAVTSPGGLRIEFQHDTGRCDGFPFLYLNDPAVVQFFGQLPT